MGEQTFSQTLETRNQTIQTPKGVESKTFLAYQQLANQHAQFLAQNISNNSIEGGKNAYYNREKFGGDYTNQSLFDIKNSMERELENGNNQFRSCGRYFVQDEQMLRNIQQEVNALSSDQLAFDFALEYAYPVAGGFIVGIGANAKGRYFKNYDGAKLPRNQNNQNIPKNRRDLEIIQAQKYGKYEYQNPINYEADVVASTAALNLDQQYQLATLYMQTFGPGWTIETVKNHDNQERPIRVAINRQTGKIIAAVIADIDEKSIELTEWVSAENKDINKANATLVANHLIDYCVKKYAGKTLFGEFRTTNGSIRNGFGLGFSLPPTISGVYCSNIIFSNVPVGGILTDFAPLVYNYKYPDQK